MLLIIENIKLALSSIKANKMRSFLTMLGIIIGISSVITIASLGETSKAVIGKEFEAFGKGRVIIFLPYSEELRDSDFFFMEDIEKVKARYREDIVYLEPSTYSSSEAINKRKKAKVDISGVGSGYTEMVNVNIVKGRFLSEGDIKSRRYVSVVDKVMADELFPGEDAIGKTVRISVDGQPADSKIIGIYEKEKSIFDAMMKSDSTTMYMPYSVFPSQLTYMGQLDMKIDESKSSIEVGNRIADFLSRMKNRETGFYRVNTTQGEQNTIDQVLGTLSLAIGAIAAISLVVGGIGIMNIMLVSVTERTKEIGIRKSLGARRKDILLQFLVESMIVSATGGIIGTALGLALASVVSIVLDVPPVVSPGIIIVAVLFSAVVGVFFGIYPANRAAKLDPIDALRYE